MSSDKWINSMCYTHKTEYYLSIKENEVLLYARIQMNLEILS